jgi:hypothetical protein
MVFPLVDKYLYIHEYRGEKNTRTPTSCSTRTIVYICGYYYEYKKKTSRAFSLRYFAEKSGISSHAHLKLTMDGSRNITNVTINKLIRGIGLENRRAAYFENLVFFNQATSDVDKNFITRSCSR